MNSDYLSKYKSAFFESPRLFYRGIALEDAAEIVGWRSNGQILRFFISKTPITMERHLAWFEKYLTDPTRFDFIMIEKATNQKIGTVGLQNLFGTAADISYLLDIKSQGVGFGVEAIRAMSTYAFEYLKLQRLSAVILAGNSASKKAAERAGYSLYSQTYMLKNPEEG